MTSINSVDWILPGHGWRSIFSKTIDAVPHLSISITCVSVNTAKSIYRWRKRREAAPDGKKKERWQWTPTPCEGDPSGVSGGLAVPVRHHQQTTGDGEGDDAKDDEEERGDPLRGQLRGDAAPVSAVNSLALPDQSHGKRAWMKNDRRGGSLKKISCWDLRQSSVNRGLRDGYKKTQLCIHKLYRNQARTVNTQQCLVNTDYID